MTKLLLTLVLASALFTVAHADEASDYISANALWADDAEFQRMNNAQDQDYISANVLWADNDEFQRADSDQAQYASNDQLDHDYINANMLWSDDREFQAH